MNEKWEKATLKPPYLLLGLGDFADNYLESLLKVI